MEDIDDLTGLGRVVCFGVCVGHGVIMGANWFDLGMGMMLRWDAVVASGIIFRVHRIAGEGIEFLRMETFYNHLTATLPSLSLVIFHIATYG
jgi:hypothetical protein